MKLVAENGNSIRAILGADNVFNLMAVTEAGDPTYGDGRLFDLTGVITLTLEFFPAATRTASPVATKTPVYLADSKGYCTLTIAAAEATLARGTYFVWLKTVRAGVTTISSNPIALQII